MVIWEQISDYMKKNIKTCKTAQENNEYRGTQELVQICQRMRHVTVKDDTVPQSGVLQVQD